MHLLVYNQNQSDVKGFNVLRQVFMPKFLVPLEQTEIKKQKQNKKQNKKQKQKQIEYVRQTQYSSNTKTRCYEQFSLRRYPKNAA